MLIRPATCHDRNEILALLRRRGTFNDMEITVAMQVFDDAFRLPGNEDYQIFCACCEDGDIAGYICFGPITITDNCYDLYWIAVDERFSRKGTGEKLLLHMEECITRKGARRVYIETSSTPPFGMARSFYEKHGYKLIGTIPDFYRQGDHKLTFVKEICRPVPHSVGTEFVAHDGHLN